MTCQIIETFIKGQNREFNRQPRVRNSLGTAISVTVPTFTLVEDETGTTVINGDMATTEVDSVSEYRLNYRLNTASLNTGRYTGYFSFLIDGEGPEIVPVFLEIVGGP